jgi:hypothetical protein
MEVDNLEKFAKTSHTAEVVLERLKSSQKKQSERHEVSGKSDDNSASSSRTQIWLMPISSLIQSCPLRRMQSGSLTT